MTELSENTHVEELDLGSSKLGSLEHLSLLFASKVLIYVLYTSPHHYVCLRADLYCTPAHIITCTSGQTCIVHQPTSLSVPQDRLVLLSVPETLILVYLLSSLQSCILKVHITYCSFPKVLHSSESHPQRIHKLPVLYVWLPWLQSPIENQTAQTGC